MTPTQRSLKALRELGYLVEVVEKWNSFTRTRKDLWGWADLLAIRRGEVLAVQVTAQAVANRVQKVTDSETIGRYRTGQNRQTDSVCRNSRTHSDAQVAQIAASIKEFGFTNPVLIDETGSIIAGHGRVMAARKLAITDVPSIRLTHLTEAQKKAYVIADNKLALNAGWDDEMLAVELTDLKDMGFDLDLTGFSTDEIEALLAPDRDGGADRRGCCAGGA
jgi:hypothetical protein